MNEADFDLAVIGGGVNGCGIARDAAGRGLSVFLCEQGDLAQATSSASTKLIHGGLRYLEYGEIRLVREALVEREVLLRNMPHIAWPMRFVLPHRRELRPAWKLRLGLLAYDMLGGRKILPGTRTLDLRRDPAGRPLREGLRRAWEYSDCWVQDSRLVVLNARDAAARGAEIAVRTRCTGARREGDRWRLTVEGPEGRREIRARALVNAAGPWVDEVLHGIIGRNAPARIRLVRGSHIVTRRLWDHDRAYMLQQPDGRIVFAIPYEDDFTLIGTTDRDHEGDPGEATCSEDEAAYLCGAVSEYLAQPIGTPDIVWSYSGVRPLYDDGAKEAKAATRDYVLDVDVGGDAGAGKGDPKGGGGAPLLNVFGGKITTYRRLSEAALKKLKPWFPKMPGPWTREASLPGGDFAVDGAAALGRRADGGARLSGRRLGAPAGAHLRHRCRGGAGRGAHGRGAGPALRRRPDRGRGALADGARVGADGDGRAVAAHAAGPAPDGRRGGRAGRVDARAGRDRRRGDMKDCVLAIDQGTTSTRALVFDRDLRVVAQAQREFPQHFPKSGWVEHDPEDIWTSSLETAREAVGAVGVERIAAIGIANQRETTMVWERATGRPIANAIVWQDRRTAAECERLKPHEALVTERSGLLLDPYFSGTKIAWLLDNVDGARERAERGELAFGTVDTWLIWRLTEGARHVTDATNASRTLLYDIRRGQWDDDLCDLLRVPAALLPEVLDSAAEFGATTLLGDEIPVLGVAGDQQAATVGQACFRPGMIKSTYGTGCFAVLNTGDQPVASKNRLLTTIAYRLDGHTTYALEGAIFVAGAAVQWLRDGLGIIGSAAETGALWDGADPAQSVYLVPAFTGLGAPHWDAAARGALFGLTRNTGPAELARAALESVGYQTRDLLEAMKRDWQGDSGPAEARSVLRVDGGMAASDRAMQFLADICDAPVDRPPLLETTALGAAWLAGMRAGLYPGPEDFARGWACERRFEPAMDAGTRTAKIAGWDDAVRRTLTAR